MVLDDVGAGEMLEFESGIKGMAFKFKRRYCWCSYFWDNRLVKEGDKGKKDCMLF